MRTTLTLDDDVAAGLRRAQRSRKAPLRAVVNDAIRQGLAVMEKPLNGRKPFRMKVLDLGRPRMNMDNVAEVLEAIEGPWHR